MYSFELETLTSYLQKRMQVVVHREHHPVPVRPHQLGQRAALLLAVGQPLEEAVLVDLAHEEGHSVRQRGPEQNVFWTRGKAVVKVAARHRPEEPRGRARGVRRRRGLRGRGRGRGCGSHGASSSRGTRTRTHMSTVARCCEVRPALVVCVLSFDFTGTQRPFWRSGRPQSVGACRCACAAASRARHAHITCAPLTRRIRAQSYSTALSI